MARTDMNLNYMGIIIGGFLPAIIFGIGGIFLKASARQGISLNHLILFAGAGAIFLAFLLLVLIKEKSISAGSATMAFCVGLSWASATALMSIAMVKFETPISIIGPLTAIASLITALLAMWIFSEWKEVLIARLLMGATLIVIGVMLVSTSSKANRIQHTIPPGNEHGDEHSY
jgi:drug/metabolite transporter (DMT)-like permease